MNAHRVNGPAEFLALLPHLAGMPVTDSVVLVPFTGARSSGAMRVDRAGFSTDPTAAAVRAIGLVCNLENVDGLVIVLTTPNPTRETTGDLIALLELARAADQAGHEVRDLLLVTSEEWISLPGRTRGPLPMVADTLNGRALCDPATLGRLPDIDPDTAGSAGRRRTADTITAAAAVAADSPTAALTLLRAGLADQPGGIGWNVAARFGVLRTLALILAGWGTDAAAAAWPELTGASPVGETSLGVQVLGGGNVRRPDAAGLRGLADALTAAAAGGSEEERGDLAAMLAWTHWALGRSSIAQRLAAAALQRNPGSDLAASVATLTRVGRLPEWAFRAEPRA